MYKVQLETIRGTMPGDTVFHVSCPDSGYSVDNLGQTATFLRSYSTIVRGASMELDWDLSEMDPGIEFFIWRSVNGKDFMPLDVSRLERDGLLFKYIDRGVEPGKSYVYRVEYTIEGTSNPLFISESLTMPAALLALYQNRPNPFNPSTMILFSLPNEGAARLEVYDVTGRLGDLYLSPHRRQGDDLAQDGAPALIDSGLIING